MRRLILCLASYAMLGGCKPDPIQTKLVGYMIEFPITMAELEQDYPNGYKSSSTTFIDSSQSIRAEWLFNTYGTNGNRDSRNNPYGVSIFLKNRGNQFDSIKTAIEKQYRKPLLLLKVTRLGKYEPYQINPPVYTCHLNKNTILTLSKASYYRSESWSQYNSVKISIGYDLDAN